MSRSFLDKFVQNKRYLVIALPAWVLASFVLVQIILYLLVSGLNAIGVPFNQINSSVFVTVSGAITYILTILMVVGLPWLVKKYKTTKEDLGIQGFPRWLDLLLAPLGLVVYMIVSVLLIYLATQFLPFIDMEQVQDTGFKAISQQFELLLAFLTLVIIAPVAEEILFRGYLFGKLRKHAPLWLAILITSLIFAFGHGAWNVGIDVFALSIVLCLLRVFSKSLWPSILLHMTKNAIAFYILFVNPLVLGTLGG